MKNNFAGVLALSAMLGTLAGCGNSSSGGANENSSDTLKINFDYQVSSVYKNVTSANQVSNRDTFDAVQSKSLNRSVNFASFRPLTGSLNVTRSQDGSIVDDFFWSSELDDEALELISTKTIVLDAVDDYDFRLTLHDGDKKYYGERIARSIIDGENDVLIVMKPVIGDTEINVDYDNFCRYDFAYPRAEFENLLTPRIGVTIDDGNEIFLEINKDTGSSIEVLSALQEGIHDLEFRLYDGNTAVGRTNPSEITVEVEDACQDLNVDFEPFHGETILTLDLDKGEANFTVNIPSEVVDEVVTQPGEEKLDNFSGIIQLSGELNTEDSLGYIQQPLVITQNQDGTYKGEVTLQNVRFEKENNPVSVSLTFTDVGNDAEPYHLGGCSFTHIISESSSTHLCMIDQLNSRRIVSGNILGIWGVNVYDQNNQPVQGATIRANAVDIGMTGGAAVFGTAGYKKMTLKKGAYLITAFKDGMFDEANIEVDSLDVKNIDLWLEPMTWGTAKGLVRHATDSTIISGVQVTAKQGDSVVQILNSNSTGAFEFYLAPGEYEFHFEKSGYHPVVYQNIEVTDQGATVVEALMMIEDTVDPDAMGIVSGSISHALSGSTVEGATVRFRSGVNNFDGEVVSETVSMGNGQFEYELQTGHYTAEIAKDGFITSYRTIIAIGNESMSGQDATLTPVMLTGETRIVLTWGTEPRDLDSHLWAADGAGSMCHVYYRSRVCSQGAVEVANLDLDDTNGEGPETTTILRQFEGVYTFRVNDFTNRNAGNNQWLGYSNATVRVYRNNGLVATINVPNEVGTWWHVFELEGDDIRILNFIDSGPTNNFGAQAPANNIK